MKFRTAYSSLTSGRKSSKPRGYFRDPTSEEWKKTMDEYYTKQRQKHSVFSPYTGSKPQQNLE